MHIKDDKVEEVVKSLKQLGFKEDEKFIGYEENGDYFAYNKETKDFSIVGSSSRTLEYYIKKFDLEPYMKIESFSEKENKEGEIK